MIDLVGGETHLRSHDILGPGGRLVWLIAQPFEAGAADTGITVRQANVHDNPETLARVVELAGEGILKPQVSQILPLEEAATAHRLLEAGENSRGSSWCHEASAGRPAVVGCAKPNGVR